ncbi:MAG: M6 family metalloprotease domain-containing protein [Desulfosarcinaceae bacterium]|nr:M6 family metalloprotease domain-containing protein [Desulfosarcinaceae bacterium]
MPAPFLNEEFTFTNPDGSTIRVRGTGNQHYAVFETLDGYTITEDPQSGFFHYADLSEDKQDLVSSGASVDQIDPATLGLRPHLRIRREAAKRKALSAPMLQRKRSQWELRREAKKQRRTLRSITAAPDAMPRADVTTGNYKGLCLLIEFPDVAPTISRQEVEDFCNKPGYTGFGNNGSVRDYFQDNSRGRLTYTNQVTAYFTAAHNRSYYSDPSQPYGKRARELIREALNHLKAQGYNFSQLTSDANGYIYALNVFYVGPTVNNWAKGLWPHASSLGTPFDAGGGKKFNDYQITNMGSELTLRTFCHENGHMICDFPDLYDYGGESAGVGHFCLMCYGGSNKNPVQVCAYLKNEAGWTSKLTTLTPGITVTLNAADNDFCIYPKSASEYFIIENRQKSARDTFLPDAGLAIWHVDETASNDNEQMTPAKHYECSLIQADNRFDLEGNANGGDAEDLYAAPDKVAFSDSTSPDSKWWDGSNSGLNIAQISASGTTMTFAFPAAAGWINNKRVVHTYAHANSNTAFAILETLSGWRKIAPTSADGVTNVLNILDAAAAKGNKVNVYLGSDNQIYAVYMV